MGLARQTEWYFLTRLFSRFCCIPAPNRQMMPEVTRLRVAPERIENLVRTLEEEKAKIIIPTPALSELLVVAGPEGAKYLTEINGRSCFKVSDFDQRAAVEAAIQIRSALKQGDKRQGVSATWAKVKFDRQIVAIAKVEGVQKIYSDDEDVEKHGKALGIEVMGVDSLPLPRPSNSNLGNRDQKRNDGQQD